MFTKLAPGDSGWDTVVKWHRGTDRREAQTNMLSSMESANRNDVIEVGTTSEDDDVGADDSTDETSEDGAYDLVVAGFNLKCAQQQAASVRERNTILLLSCPKSNHSTFGLRCVGPDPVVGLTARARRCPTSTVINYDTANLVRQVASSKSTGLSRRCVRCDAEFDFYAQLKKYELLAEDGARVCSRGDCAKPIFHGSQLCEQHLYEFRPEHACAGTSMRDELERLFKSAMNKKWHPQSKMHTVLRLFNSIRDGNADPSKLRFLDLEFNTKSGHVYEVGMCDANGIITMDCLTKYASTSEVVASSVLEKSTSWIDRLIRKSVQNHRCAHGWITARQVADMLRRQGITPDT
ncbi:hypothetical protein N0V84_006632 [Fusarium piperis]|uniref:Uncharacterized protein n=1 Tax=Fusarium piperis TaxID=1435070 RepID=A0A9W8WBJ6_9HYPO|nr:hypothetical protein N0V84_006632 [Fusarium piperis]